jgi:hypothetical protein
MLVARLVVPIAFALALLAPSAAWAVAPDTMHTIDEEAEDALGQSIPTKTRFEGKHTGTAADPYVIDMDVEKMSSTGLGGFLVFREQDEDNFYQLDFRSSSMIFKEKVGGTYFTRASVTGQGFGAVNHLYRVRLMLKGSTFELYNRDSSLAVPILTWTDPDNSYPVGRNLSYYATPDTLFCWDRVQAHPQSATPFDFAWNLPNASPGYRTPQAHTGVDVNVGNSRYPFTFDAYQAPSDDGSNPWDMVEMGQDGNVEFSFKSTANGSAIIYRAGTRDATTGLPRSGYEARAGSSGVKWGTIDSTGNFTTVVSGPVVPVGTTVYVVVNGSTHHLETRLNGGVQVLTSNRTDATYNGVRAYIGHYVNSGTVSGSFTPLP